MVQYLNQNVVNNVGVDVGIANFGIWRWPLAGRSTTILGHSIDRIEMNIKSIKYKKDTNCYL